MKFQVNDGEKYQKIMEVEIPAEELALAMRQAGKRLAARVNIPGFRKGKAPQSIIENFVGTDSILSDAADEVVPQAYFEGLKELGLSPVEQPKIEMVKLTAGEPLVFKATFTVKPEVKLGQYQGLAVTKQVREVTAAEIDADIETQRRRLSRLTEAEEGTEAVLTDVVSIDFEGFREGVPFDGGKAEKYPLELGSGSFIPGFEEQLVGIKSGEERLVNVTFPEDYQEESLAGQPVEFKVKAHEIKRRVFPELNDEFAQEVSETAENMDALRREVEERLQQRNKETANREARERALAQAAENAEMDLPPLMVEQRLDSMVQNMAERLQMQGLQMQQFLEYTGQTAEQLRESYREQAVKAVRSDLMLEMVAKAENIAISDEEVEKELTMMAGYYRQSLEQIKAAFLENNRLEVLMDDMKMNKAGDLIYDSAEITEEIISAAEAEAEDAAEAAQ